MPDPVMVAVAVALATRAAEGISDAGRSAFMALTRLVRRKLDSHPHAHAALEAAQDHPHDRARVDRLALALQEAASEDAGFADQLQGLWATVRDERGVAVHGGVLNRVSGTVSGTVIQARDVRGGISFGAPTDHPHDERPGKAP